MRIREHNELFQKYDIFYFYIIYNQYLNDKILDDYQNENHYIFFSIYIYPILIRQFEYKDLIIFF